MDIINKLKKKKRKKQNDMASGLDYSGHSTQKLENASPSTNGLFQRCLYELIHKVWAQFFQALLNLKLVTECFALFFSFWLTILFMALSLE